MLARTVIRGLLAVLACLACAQGVQARIPMHSSVSVDGKEFLKGHRTYSPSQYDYDAVGSIGYSIFSSVNASLFEVGAGRTLELKGNILFSVDGFPDMQLQSLRFVPTSWAYVETEWRLDPAEIAKINAYYEQIGQAMKRQDVKQRLNQQKTEFKSKQEAFETFVIGVPAFIFAVAFLLLAGLFTHRRVKQK